MTLKYGQRYYGDKNVVGSIIGTDGKNISAYRKLMLSAPSSFGVLHRIHWDNSSSHWVVIASTMDALSHAMNWILENECKYQCINYEKQQALGLENISITATDAQNKNWRETKLQSIGYQQSYYGDKSVVGSIIGSDGKNISAFKSSLIAFGSSLGILHWIHWDNNSSMWIVRGSTLEIVSHAINWILRQERWCHIINYQKQQAKSIDTVVIMTTNPKVGSDNQNWRDRSKQTESDDDQCKPIPGSEFYNSEETRWKFCDIGTVKYIDNWKVCEQSPADHIKECCSDAIDVLRMTDTLGEDDDRIYVKTQNGLIYAGYIDKDQDFHLVNFKY